MTAKEYLTQLKYLDDLLCAQREELNAAEEMAMSINVPISDSTASFTGHISDKTASTAIKLAELKNGIMLSLDQYVTLKINATRLINKMRDIQGMTVLYHYYLHNRTLEETALVMNRTYQNVSHIRDRALIEFQKLMDKEGIE